MGSVIAPMTNGGFYINYVSEPSDADIRRTFAGNYERLVQVKTKYDPTNFLHPPSEHQTAQGLRRRIVLRALRGACSGAVYGVGLRSLRIAIASGDFGCGIVARYAAMSAMSASLRTLAL